MAMTTDEAKRWLDEAEQKSPADVSWIELQEAITTLKMVATSSLDEPYGTSYLDRALALAHRKAQPYVMNARAGDTSDETVDELMKAAQTVRASTNQRGQIAGVDQQFLNEVGRLLNSNMRAAPGRERGATREAVAGRIRQSTEAYKAGRPKEKFFEAAARAGIPDYIVEMDWATLEAQASAAGVTLDAMVEQKIAEYQITALEARGPAIGPQTPAATLPLGFEAVRTDPTQAATEGLQMQRDREGRQGPNRSTTVPARYFDGDELNPAGYAEERRVALQEALVKAGLLGPDEYYVGQWDAESMGAYRTVLGYANVWGLTAEETIRRLQETIPASMQDDGSGAGAGSAVARVYVKPDYASLAQEVKQTFRNRLGRDPRDEELTQLANQLSGFYRAQFDAQVAADDQARAANERAEETGGDPGTIAYTGVDPIARFNELFEQRYKPEEDRLEGLDDTRFNTENVFASLRTMGNMVGG